jgi:hypothetical protein
MHAVAGFRIGRSNHIPRGQLDPPAATLNLLFPFWSKAKSDANNIQDSSNRRVANRFLRFLNLTIPAFAQDLAAVWHHDRNGWQDHPVFQLLELQSDEWGSFVHQMHSLLTIDIYGTPLSRELRDSNPEIALAITDLRNTVLNANLQQTQQLQLVNQRLDHLSASISSLNPASVQRTLDNVEMLVQSTRAENQQRLQHAQALLSQTVSSILGAPSVSFYILNSSVLKNKCSLFLG